MPKQQHKFVSKDLVRQYYDMAETTYQEKLQAKFIAKYNYDQRFDDVLFWRSTAQVVIRLMFLLYMEMLFKPIGLNIKTQFDHIQQIRAVMSYTEEQYLTYTSSPDSGPYRHKYSLFHKYAIAEKNYLTGKPLSELVGEIIFFHEIESENDRLSLIHI